MTHPSLFTLKYTTSVSTFMDLPRTDFEAVSTNTKISFLWNAILSRQKDLNGIKQLFTKYCTMGTGGALSTGVKARPGRDADHSPPSSEEVKKGVGAIPPVTPEEPLCSVTGPLFYFYCTFMKATLQVLHVSGCNIRENLETANKSTTNEEITHSRFPVCLRVAGYL
jgi:hypothetical protein